VSSFPLEKPIIDFPARPVNKDRLVTTLQAQVQAQAEELDARRREVQELHVLLQSAQAQLPPPPKAQRRRRWQIFGIG